jgi:hypothetical protein
MFYFTPMVQPSEEINMAEAILELAQKGNADAIAALLNRSLKVQGITAKVATHTDRLQVLLEGLDIPAERDVVPFITQGMQKLNLTTVKVLQIYGQQLGQTAPAWVQAFVCSAEGINPAEDLALTQEPFGEQDLRLLARQGDWNAIQTFVTQAIDNPEFEVSVELNGTALKVLVMTSEFLDGATFASNLGKKLNAIASPTLQTFELHKQKSPESNPFMIQRVTLDQSLAGRI